MSVEEARRALDTVVDAGPSWISESASYQAARDRLILEVQAAMPCYGEYTGTDCPPAHLRKFLGDPQYQIQCSSCAARAELRKVSA